MRSLRLCHSRGVDSRESKPVALLCYGKGTQPWDAEIDEVFECRKGRSPLCEAGAFDEMWIGASARPSPGCAALLTAAPRSRGPC